MASKVFVALLLVAVAAVLTTEAAYARECGKYEVWDECGFCERRCDNKPTLCHPSCVPNCYCPPGMFRKGKDCVPEAYCNNDEPMPLAMPCGEFDPECI